MASRIILDPETLLAQAGEMQNLTAEYEALFSKVTGTLNDTNNHWSELLAHNFAGKISSAQQSFASITELLASGAAAAKNSATTMQSVDQSLFKVFGGSRRQTFESQRLEILAQRLKDLSRRQIETGRHRLALIEQAVHTADPQRILRMGYSITLRNGKLIRSAAALSPGDRITTRLADGDVDSTVIKS